jgi:alkanesulfonate monooxygenase SsuD/methylene tetrahydromethanopterin reductase-like flavin-dependent oxidoreductase (luciferase family)
VTPVELAAAVAVARNGAADAGRDPDALTVALHLPTLVTDAASRWPQVRDALHYPGWKYDDMDEAHGSVGPLRPPGPLTGGDDRRLRETSLTGTPDQVAERIQAYAAAAGGALHFVARSYLPGQDHARRVAALDGLAEVRALLAPTRTAESVI